MSPKPAAHPTLPQPTQQLLIQQLLWMLLLRVILYTLILGVSFYLQSRDFGLVLPPTPMLTSFIFLIYITSIISGFFILGSKKDPVFFGLVQNFLDTTFVSVLIYYTGASHSIFSPIYFFPIIAGGLILPRLGGLLSAGAATLQFGLILTFEYFHFFPDVLNVSYNYFYDKDSLKILNLFAVYGLTFFLAAILSSLFAGRLRKTEDALSDSLRSFDQLSLLYKQIFDDIATGIITINDKGHITSANNAASVITSYDAGKLLGKNFNNLFPNIDLTNKGNRHSATIEQKDGEQIRIGYSFAILQSGIDPDGKPCSDSEIEDCNCGKVLTIQDISEVERLQQKMQQAEKLAAIGRMSAGIAHDFRNPLTAISGSAQVLSNEILMNSSPQQEENSELVHIILRESNRLSNTISDFLKFAKPEHAEKEWFSCDRCLREVIEVAKADPAWSENCRLEVDVSKKIDIWADQYQFFTVLNHLLQNGLAFCPKNEEHIRIVANEIKDTVNMAVVQVSVEDNGPGIMPGKEEKIFEPFYTRRVDGTGLGLAIVKQIIEAHQGTITVGTSDLGGAKFVFTMPLP